MRITPTNSFLAAIIAAAVLTGCGSSGVGDVLGGPRSGGSNGRYDPYNQNAGDVQGTVRSVDTRNRLIVVDSEDSRYNLRNGNGDREVVVYYDDRTTVEHGGRTYRPEDLERGDRIRADVEATGDRLVAQQIEVVYDVSSGGSDTGDSRDDLYTSDLRGTIRYVDTRNRTLELETSRYGSGFAPEGSSSSDRYGSGDVVVVSYDAQTVVEYQGRRYEPENLERGDRVEVDVRDSGGRRLAERIVVVGENEPVGR